MKKIICIIFSVMFLLGCQDYNLGIPGVDKIDAYVASEKFVKMRLKNPHTAAFPAQMTADIRKLSDDTCSVSSYVDSKNDFGGEIRMKFAVKMQLKDQKWHLLDIKMTRE